MLQAVFPLADHKYMLMEKGFEKFCMKEACLSLFELGLSKIYAPWNLFPIYIYSVVMHFEKHHTSIRRNVA